LKSSKIEVLKIEVSNHKILQNLKYLKTKILEIQSLRNSNAEVFKTEVLKNGTLSKVFSSKLDSLQMKSSKIEVLKNWSLQNLQVSKDDAFRNIILQKLKNSKFNLSYSKSSRFRFLVIEVFQTITLQNLMSSVLLCLQKSKLKISSTSLRFKRKLPVINQKRTFYFYFFL